MQTSLQNAASFPGSEILKSFVRKVRGRDPQKDYRYYLFEEVLSYLKGRPVSRILEIGPKDGLDTRRLMTLNPQKFTLLDLPEMTEANERWLKPIQTPAMEYVSANLMYDPEVLKLEPYDLVWCTGVLYHNPEQLRMVRRLYDLTRPGGILVLESATARHPLLRDECCVEIIYPMTDEIKKKYHVSTNVTHLPSISAMEAWMKMVGFDAVVQGDCHKRISTKMGRDRAAFLGTKPVSGAAGRYYNLAGRAGYEIGNSV